MGARIFGIPLPLIAATLVANVSGSLQAGYQAGETLWRSDFTARECAALGIPADVLGAQGGKTGDGALVFRLERKGNRKVVIRTGVKVAGAFLVEAVVKGRDVTRGPNGWCDSPDNVVNMSHLLAAPAGRDGRVRVKDGHGPPDSVW